MPYIEIKTNKQITPQNEKNLREELGKIIGTFPGKSETWLMIAFQDNVRMAFSGTDEPCAMVEVKLFGEPTAEACSDMTALLTPLISEELGLLRSRVYMKYEGCKYWGFYGSNF